MRVRFAAALAAVIVAACGGVPPGLPGSLTPLSQAELKYRLIDRFGSPAFCDPDMYPVAQADQRTQALRHLAEIQRDQPTYQAILRRHGLAAGPLTDQQATLVYQDWKTLNAVPLTPRGTGYDFNAVFAPPVSTNAQPFRAVRGSISGAGDISVVSNAPAAPMACPICLAATALIGSPEGPIKVAEIRPGTLVWTAAADGSRQAAPVLRTASMAAPEGHHMVRVRLADGRGVEASPRHPTADGRTLGQLRAGDVLDGSPVTRTELVAYAGARTYDLLPAGPSGTYWADGVRLGSTLG